MNDDYCPVTFSYELFVADEEDVDADLAAWKEKGRDVSRLEEWRRTGEMIPARMETKIGRTGDMENLYDDGWLVWIRREEPIDAYADEQAQLALEWLCNVVSDEFYGIKVTPEQVWPRHANVQIENALRTELARSI